jgi:hypothetical protein
LGIVVYLLLSGSLLVIIPVSYLGGRLGANKPRWIASGMLVLGLGSLGRSTYIILRGKADYWTGQAYLRKRILRLGGKGRSTNCSVQVLV